MPTPAPLLIDFENLTFPRGDKDILRHFRLQLKRGEHVAILGPNGSGKSTLIKAITRELYPIDRGRRMKFRILGRDNWDLEELRQHFGIVSLDQLQHLSHEVTLRQITARELVLSGFFNSIGLWPHQRITPAQERQSRKLLRMLAITHLGDRPVSAMSSGEQRRALIGRALVHEPAVLILDEPTNSLDPGAVREFRTLLRKLSRQGRSLLLVTHHIGDVIPEIDRVIMLKKGRILADGAKAGLLTSAMLSRLFDAKLRVVHHRGQYDIVSG